MNVALLHIVIGAQLTSELTSRVLDQQSAGDRPGHTHQLPNFPRYGHSVQQLDGYWDFAFSQTEPPHAADGKTWVPNVLQEGGSALRGVALYERPVTVPPGQHGRLQFYGCGFKCTIALDGEVKARHAVGYTVFWVDVPEGTHTLRVQADTRLEEHGVDQPWFDFMDYGGLLRPVVLHTTPLATMVEGLDLIQHDAESGTLRFRLHRFTAAKPPLRVHVAGEAIGALDLDVDEERLEHAVRLRGKRWSPADPHLSTITARVDGLEALTVRVGLRIVSACGARVCLDGVGVKLLGFNMHNLDPEWGQTAPHERLEAWLAAAEKAGANFLRLVHYPHDALTLEKADERGLLLWTETLGWGTHLEDLTASDFQGAQVSMLNEAIPITYNHPSVVLFGFLNEGDDNNAAACPLYERLANTYRTWKVNGLVTWGSNKYLDDQCLDSADVVSFNLYPGWYSNTDNPVQEIPAVLGQNAQRVHEKYPGKPFLVSEVGAAGIPSTETWSRPEGPVAQAAQLHGWSVDYQATVDGAAAEAAVCDPLIAGMAIWQLFDTRTSEKRTPLRPRGMNNKGVLNENGALKPAFAAVQRAFQGHVPCPNAGPVGSPIV